MLLTRYIFREIVSPFLMGLTLYTAVFLFGYFFVGAPYLDGVPLPKVLKWMAYHIPEIWVQVLPMAVVMMVVMGYGRMNTERELVAMMSGGITLRQITGPALILAAAVAGFSLFLNEYVVSKTSTEVRRLWYEELPKKPYGLQRLEKSLVNLGNNLDMYYQRYDPNTDKVYDVRIQSWNGNQGTIILAKNAAFDNKIIKLQGYQLYTIDYNQIAQLQDTKPENLGNVLPSIFKNVALPARNDSILSINTGISRAQAIAKYADGFSAETASLSDYWNKMKDATLTTRDRIAARIELNSKLALPISNLVLAFISLPFAIRFGRGAGVSMGISVLIVVVYYITFLVGRSLVTSGVLIPEIGIWLANIIFTAIGWRLLNR